MTYFFVCLSDLGHGAFYVSICILTCLLAWVSSGEKSKLFVNLTWCLATFWSWGVLINTGLKFAILAPRPWYVDIVLSPLHPSPSGGYGMPSGHTQSAVGLYLLCWYAGYLFKDLKYAKVYGWGLRILGLLWVFLIAWSRVHLAAHSLGQVLTGAGVGFALMLFIVWVDQHPKGLIWGYGLLLFSLSSCLWRIIYPYQVPQIWLESSHEYAVSIPQAPSFRLVIVSFVLSAFCLLIRQYQFKSYILKIKN